MNSEQNFQDRSYKRHAEHFDQYRSGSDREKQAKTWLENDTVDAWRHRRIYQNIDPILEFETDAKWLTVGDGRYGNDANYLISKHIDALASDISDALLKEAVANGHIPKYSKENAEHLSFPDSTFDYVLCKEAYHHFPRPMIALYEMLRVSKKGVFLIEPNDPYITDKISKIFFNHCKNLLKHLLKKPHGNHDFEDTGNFVFRVSRREMEKVALGLNYRTIAFKGINNAYFQGVEFEKLSSNGIIQKKVKTLIGINNFLCRFGIASYNLLAIVIFKETPSIELQQRLMKSGFDIVHLPKNPYISS